MKERWKNGEFYLGLLLLALFIILFRSVDSIKNESARIWPRIVLVPFGVSALAIFLMSFRKTFTDVKMFLLSKKEGIIVAAMLAAALLENYIGLLPALFLLTIAINATIQGVWSWRALAKHVLFSLILIGICYLVFDLWLQMYLPKGSWLQ